MHRPCVNTFVDDLLRGLVESAIHRAKCWGLRMWGPRHAGVGLALIFVMLTGCGGDDDGQAVGSTAETAAATSTAPSDDSPSAGTGEYERFCAELETAGEKLQSLDHGGEPTDLEDVVNVLQETRDAMQSIDPPDDIGEDWTTLISYFDAAVKGSENLDFSDPTELEQQLEDLTKLMDDGSAKIDELDAKLKDKCGMVAE